MAKTKENKSKTNAVKTETKTKAIKPKALVALTGISLRRSIVLKKLNK